MMYLSNGSGEKLKLKYSELKTFTGLTLDLALKQLQRKLDDAAYKKVTGGGKELTDIKPAWLTEELTTVFGIAGVGWYFGFDQPEIVETPKRAQSGREYISYQADILNGWLIYRLVDAEGSWLESEPIRATGGSDNEVKEYAIRGAVTNMLGAAASKLCWQLFVYKGEKDNPSEGGNAVTGKKVEAKKKEPDARHWSIIALEYAKSHKDVWDVPLGKSEAGERVIGLLKKECGPGKWFMVEKNMLAAVLKYTGFKIPEEMGWPEFEKLTRYYVGPHARPGDEVKDVLFHHYIKPSDWQNLLAAIPAQEDFVLDEVTAEAFNIAIDTASNYVKDKKLDVESVAVNLRKFFVKIAEPVPPTSELVTAVEDVEEIPY